MSDGSKEYKDIITILDKYTEDKKQLQEREEEYKKAVKELRKEVVAAEKQLLTYCKENDIKVLSSSKSEVEVQSRKSTTINLKKLFAYSLGKLRNMRLFLASVKPQVGTVKKLYNQQALVDKGILKVVDNNYHHLKVVPTTWE